MKNSIIILIIGAAIIFFGCTENQSTSPEFSQSDFVTNTMAKKPAPKLIGTMELDFMFVNPVWVGTVDLEGHGVYGIRFENLGGKDAGQASHFVENCEIYDLQPPFTIYLGISDFGVVSMANSKYRMNGEIDVATGEFEEWMGRHVHMSGIITWQNLGTVEEPDIAPDTAPGTLRIN